MERVLYDIKGNARRKGKLFLNEFKEKDLYRNLP